MKFLSKVSYSLDDKIVDELLWSWGPRMGHSHAPFANVQKSIPHSLFSDIW